MEGRWIRSRDQEPQTQFRSGSSPRRAMPSAPAARCGRLSFADAAGFEPKAGRLLLLPGEGAARPAFCSGSKAPTSRRICFCPGGSRRNCRRGPIGFAKRSARCPAGGARLRARRLPLRALPQGGRREVKLDLPQGSTARTWSASSRRDAGARPHQHAGERHGAAELEARPASSPPSWRHHQRRSSATMLAQKLPADPCGRPRRRARAAADRSQWGDDGPPARDAGRQRRLFRYRRARHQARQRPCC